MRDYPSELKSIPKRHDFLICIDSDGTVFDTMPAKHRCFRDALIRCFSLKGVDAECAAEVWKYVNLDSVYRGENRFRSLLLTLDLMRERGVATPDASRLRAWIARENRLGNPALLALLEQEPGEEMSLIYRWSLESDEAIAANVRGIKPFPLVRESLSRASESADLVVVSHTPCATLAREWREHAIDRFVLYLAGQECGTKTDHIRLISNGKYTPDHVLMIGDSRGDRSAAGSCGTLFFPIVPGHEAESWRAFFQEGLGRFLEGSFAGDYQERLLDLFQTVLLREPPWKHDSSSSA